jgi:hypothetical protein
MPISAKVSERISTQIKKYTPILNELVTKDVNEADTGAIRSCARIRYGCGLRFVVIANLLTALEAV